MQVSIRTCTSYPFDECCIILEAPVTDKYPLDALQYRSRKGQCSPVGFSVDFGTKKQQFISPKSQNQHRRRKMYINGDGATMMIDGRCYVHVHAGRRGAHVSYLVFVRK